ncbi:MAG: hypothetical protein AAFY76_17025 [Cyanobacteria bacterium J06649_11]
MKTAESKLNQRIEPSKQIKENVKKSFSLSTKSSILLLHFSRATIGLDDPFGI